MYASKRLAKGIRNDRQTWTYIEEFQRNCTPQSRHSGNATEDIIDKVVGFFVGWLKGFHVLAVDECVKVATW
jgi:hypothetical protein